MGHSCPTLCPTDLEKFNKFVCGGVKTVDKTVRKTSRCQRRVWGFLIASHDTHRFSEYTYR